MSDPLSIASAVAGLVSLTIEATRLTCKYVAEVSHAGEAVLQCLRSLSLLRDVLARIQESSADGDLALILQRKPQLMAKDDVKRCEQSIDKVRGRLEALFHDDGKIKKRHALTWPFKNAESADLVKQLQEFRDMFAALIAADTLDVSVKSHQVAVETRSVVRDIKDGMASGKRGQATQALLEWIFPEAMETWRLGVDRLPSYQGTGAWLFDSAVFLDWVDSGARRRPVLWCLGPPGSGKSVLMSQAISRIQNQPSQTSGSPKTLVISHFCDHRDSQTQSPDVIIRHLMRQAALQSDSVVANLQKCKEYQDTKRSGRSLRLEELLRIFLDECLSSDSRFAIVLDGLDECAEELAGLEARHEILQLITKAASIGTRILVASRDLADIRAELGDCSSELKVRAPDSDLRSYVTRRLQGIEKRVARAESFKEAIVAKVVQDADGIFLLARLMMDILAPSSINNIRQIKKFLEEPHCDLTKMYEETLTRIMSNNAASADLARKLLLWLCYSQRPLRESEIQHALATELGDDDFDDDGLTPGELLQACCLGIVVSNPEGIYSLFHQTAYDFFRSSPELGSAAAHLLISKTCLCYLSFSTMRDQGPCQSLETLEKRREYFSLLDYAAKHWADHARQVEDVVIDQIISFITDEVLRQCLAQGFYYRKRDDKELQQRIFDSLPTGSTALQVACGRGLPITAKSLLARDLVPKNVTQADDQGWTPFMWCLTSDTEEKDVIGLNKADEAGWTPLFWAVVKGNGAAAERLLAAGACASLQDESGWTPIDWAAFRADKSLVTLLLQHASLPTGYDYGERSRPREFSAIFLAAAAGDNETVEALLQKGATAPVGDGMPARKIERLLHKIGGKVEDYYHSGGTREHRWISTPSVVMTVSFTIRLFESAIRFDQLAIVKMLVELGSPLGAVKGELKDRSALHIAACCGNRRICEYLVSKGADVSLQDGDGYTPLDLAITVAAIPCIKLFLECLDPRSKTMSRLIEDGNAPAEFLYGWKLAIDQQKYSRRTPENMVKTQLEPHVRQDSLYMLEASGASTAVGPLVDFPSRNNANDLRTSQDDGDSDSDSDGGNDEDDDAAIEVLRALLDRGCNVNLAGENDGEIPLHFACRLSKPKLVSFLLENGADVNIVEELYKQPPLTIACAARVVSLDVVRALVQGGADVNATNEGLDFEGHSALLAACHNAPAEVVRYLIASGARVSTCDADGRRPLHLVCDILSSECCWIHDRGAKATVLNFAIAAENWAAVDLLHSRGATALNTSLTSPTLWDHATNPRGEIFRRLVGQYGADPTALVDGDPIIMHCLMQYSQEGRAARDGFEDAVVALMEAGADINAVADYTHLTALASSIGMDLEFMRILLRHGADATGPGMGFIS
ncbi:hypothetical protein PG997_011579 [Apiospora hydei]|uniref:Nephrocystin 3-like N-terminal domain-containing protein n=1 Tax=Apiospora hydei TaxID=1337664 RepID=A0ABR1VM49_9PEZI